VIRRSIDFVSAAIALVLLAPVFAVLAAFIAIESPGNPFYGGRRVGRGGSLFRMWKFRTMVKHADRVGPGITSQRDPRITRLGAFLRRTKLDELPQFFNLLVGDVTLVGPRAEVPDIVARYSDAQRAILAVKPGIVGPGQLYYTTDQQQEIPDGVAADDYYVEHLLGPKLDIDLDYERSRTAWSDMRMLLTTVGVMARGLFGKHA
jgi:lipopolysaccharide/colanic/teichoic acid biosynthesis glycosyltransferase